MFSSYTITVRTVFILLAFIPVKKMFSKQRKKLISSPVLVKFLKKGNA